jgi:hypothetical protein
MGVEDCEGGRDGGSTSVSNGVTYFFGGGAAFDEGLYAGGGVSGWGGMMGGGTGWSGGEGGGGGGGGCGVYGCEEGVCGRGVVLGAVRAGFEEGGGRRGRVRGRF